MGDDSIEIVDCYPYLGLTLNYNGNFTVGKKKIVQQAQKALFALYSKIRNIPISIDVQIKLFDVLITPILLYGSEVWGYEKKDMIEKIHLQFCKKILCMKSSTPNYMVYGELGRHPLD